MGETDSVEDFLICSPLSIKKYKNINYQEYVRNVSDFVVNWLNYQTFYRLESNVVDNLY